MTQCMWPLGSSPLASVNASSNVAIYQSNRISLKSQARAQGIKDIQDGYANFSATPAFRDVCVGDYQEMTK